MSHQNIFTDYEPPAINNDSIVRILCVAREKGTINPTLAIVTGTKTNFYMQASLVREATSQQVSTFTMDTLGCSIQLNIRESIA
jgi:hypothetical protein